MKSKRCNDDVIMDYLSRRMEILWIWYVPCAGRRTRRHNMYDIISVHG